MKIVFLGDSITHGAWSSTYEKCYVSLVGEKFNCLVKNFGICGTRIAKQQNSSPDPIWDYNFVQRAEMLDADADFVFVFGGTNDFEHGDAPMGDLCSNNVNTFSGAVNILTDYLLKKFSKDKVCFLLPTRRFNENNIIKNITLLDYVNRLETILRNKGIDYIDLYNKAFPKPLVDTGDEFTVDGLHPNDKGHQILADIIYDYLSKKI